MIYSHASPSNHATGREQLTVIDGRRGGLVATAQDVWNARSLALLLIWRDVKVRYHQAAFGAAWAVLRPLMVMVILSLVFGRLARFDTGDVPYASFVLAGIVVWSLFATALSDMSTSVVRSQSLVTKVYFPRMVLPLSSLGIPLLDSAVASLLLIATLLVQGVEPSWRWLLSPFPIGLAVITATGLGLWLAGLNARYRDVPHVVPFVLQAWFFATPIVYPAGLVPAEVRSAYFLNPMALAVDVLRWCLFGSEVAVGALSVLLSLLMVAAISLLGAQYFDRVAGDFADVV